MISEEDVKKLASLARIKLTPEEETKYAKDMESILGYVSQVTKAGKNKTEQVVSTHRNIFRDDNNPHESGIHSEELLKSAPHREQDYVKVKKILQ